MSHEQPQVKKMSTETFLLCLVVREIYILKSNFLLYIFFFDWPPENLSISLGWLSGVCFEANGRPKCRTRVVGTGGGYKYLLNVGVLN